MSPFTRTGSVIMSAAVSTTEGNLTANLPPPVSRLPAGISRLFRRKVSASASLEIRYASSASGSIRTSKTSSRAPRRSALRTEGTVSMASRRERIASYICLSLAPSDKRLICNNGKSSTLSCSTKGSSAVVGISDLARLTASRVSSSATFKSISGSNSTPRETKPSFATAEISLMPSTLRNSTSTGCISRRSPSSGEIPSCMTPIKK